jgi:hypothetical protein
MIDIKDLRYGNIVKDNNPKSWSQLKDVPLKIITTGETVDFNKNTTYTASLEFIGGVTAENCSKYGCWTSLSQFIEFIEPIPITEDLLPKIGFECEYKSKVTKRYTHKEFGQFGYDWNGEGNDDGWKFRYYGHYFKCEFLHQIQNKFYELSEPQQELEIKL